MEVVWLSSNKFGYELLKNLVKFEDMKKHIKKIITLNDKTKTIMYDGIKKKKWYEFGIDVIEIDDINKEEKLIKKISPDLIIACGWRQLIKEDILNIPKNGIVGFHPTLLPIGRGPAPIINSILYNFKKSGVTMFYFSEGLDDGDIIGQEAFVVEKSDHAEEVYEKVIKSGKKLIIKYFPMLIKGIAPRIPQDSAKAIVFKKPDLQENKINLDEISLDFAYKKIRALSKPYNGAYIEKDGKKLILWRAELLEK